MEGEIEGEKYLYEKETLTDYFSRPKVQPKHFHGWRAGWGNSDVVKNMSFTAKAIGQERYPEMYVAKECLGRKK